MISEPIANTVVYCTDSTYLLPTLVSLISAKRNSSYKLSYKIIFEGQLCDRQKSKIQRVLKKNGLNQYCEVIPYSFSQKSKFPKLGEVHITQTTYLRLLIPGILNITSGKILYMDGDTIINCDVGQLLQTDLEGKTVGAVVDTQAYARTVLSYCNDQYQFGANELYFNSGVLLIDIDSYVKKYVEKRATEFCSKYGKLMRFGDQDALNVALRGDWLRLDIKYNWQGLANFDPTMPGNPIKYENNGIRHFVGANKPWHTGVFSKTVLSYHIAIWRSGYYNQVEYLASILSFYWKNIPRKFLEMIAR
jgi:lipopolysaccharide biosynthesis glycosyltransferase